MQIKTSGAPLALSPLPLNRGAGWPYTTTSLVLYYSFNRESGPLVRRARSSTAYRRARCDKSGQIFARVAVRDTRKPKPHPNSTLNTYLHMGDGLHAHLQLHRSPRCSTEGPPGTTAEVFGTFGRRALRPSLTREGRVKFRFQPGSCLFGMRFLFAAFLSSWASFLKTTSPSFHPPRPSARRQRR